MEVVEFPTFVGTFVPNSFSAIRWARFFRVSAGILVSKSFSTQEDNSLPMLYGVLPWAKPSLISC